MLISPLFITFKYRKCTSSFSNLSTVTLSTKPISYITKLDNIFLSLLQLLTINNYTLKDSFDTTNKIKSVPSEIFQERYQFVSFEVEYLCTNVPLNKTI